MARGPKKHLKRLNAPKHWMLGRLDGVFAPRPSTGPHKLRECLPLIIILRNRLKYAFTRSEANIICQERCVKIDGKVRTDMNFPAGFMDVLSLEKSSDLFRVLYDVKGRFVLHNITEEESKYKLARVNKIEYTKKKIPYLVTHDGRTIRYPDPTIKVNDVIKIDISTGEIKDFISFGVGNLVMITHGANTGRIGTLNHIERHLGSFDIVSITDAAGHTFATRLENLFTIGKGDKPWVTLPKGKGVKLSIIEERNARLKKNN